MITEHPIERVLPRLSEDILVIVAPNYEERSLSALSRLVKHFSEAGANGIVFVILSIYGARLRGLQDSFRARNLKRAKEILKSRGFRHQELQIFYPQEKGVPVGSNIRHLLQALTPPVNILLDSSCLPKRVLLVPFSV